MQTRLNACMSATYTHTVYRWYGPTGTYVLSLPQPGRKPTGKNSDSGWTGRCNGAGKAVSNIFNRCNKLIKSNDSTAEVFVFPEVIFRFDMFVRWFLMLSIPYVWFLSSVGKRFIHVHRSKWRLFLSFDTNNSAAVKLHIPEIFGVSMEDQDELHQLRPKWSVNCKLLLAARPLFRV